MSLRIVEVKTSKESQDFIDLLWTLYKDDPYWVPPLKIAEKQRFDPKHPFFETAHMARFIAYKGGVAVGRIAAIYNKAHNNFHEEKIGHFGFFESINDPEVAKALFSAAENYLAPFKVTSILGPMNPSTNYECGFLLDGYDDPPQLMMTYNPPYYHDLLEGLHYTKAKDLLGYKLERKDRPQVPERVKRIADKLKEAKHISCRQINLKNWKQEVETLFEIYNQAWEKNWGFVPYTQKEFFHMANDLKLLVAKELALVLEVRGIPVGVLVALPDYNQIFKQIPSGKLFPLGLFKLLFGKKKINRARVVIMGVKKEFRTLGLSTLFFQEIFNVFYSLPQYQEVEMSWMLEDNHFINNPIRALGAKHYKTYRLYQKEVSSL